jgi:hypothetical protein
MMQAPPSSKTPVLTRTTRRNIPEDGILETKRIYKLITKFVINLYIDEARVSIVIEALRQKREGSGFEARRDN